MQWLLDLLKQYGIPEVRKYEPPTLRQELKDKDEDNTAASGKEINEEEKRRKEARKEKDDRSVGRE